MEREEVKARASVGQGAREKQSEREGLFGDFNLPRFCALVVAPPS